MGKPQLGLVIPGLCPKSSMNPSLFRAPFSSRAPYSRLSFHPGIELHLHAENALPPTGSREAGYLPEVPCCDGLIN